MIPPVADRFIAGETASEALEYIESLNDDGIGGILNHLGEHHDEVGVAKEETRRYIDLLDELSVEDVNSCISVKPSQLGLEISEGVFEDNLRAILEAGRENETFVWLDMEDHTTTSPTLDAYADLARENDGGLGVCLQANLRRSMDDLERISTVPGKVRLVKGAYNEPRELAYRKKSKVNDAYRELLEKAFSEFEGTVAVASHDSDMVDYALELHKKFGTPLEFQMLMGVRFDLQRELAAEHRVWQYVPFGQAWLSYFYRRISERKENALFALRAILGR